jgi:hypothetical protein
MWAIVLIISIVSAGQAHQFTAIGHGRYTYADTCNAARRAELQRIKPRTKNAQIIGSSCEIQEGEVRM